MTPAWRLAFGALGVATALTAATIGFILSEDNPVVSAPVSKSDSILVARQPIQAGARIAESDLEWRSVPAGTDLSDAVRRSQQSDSEVVGAIAQRSMISGEVIRKGTISAQPAPRTVAASLNPGWRAVTITADAAQATGLLNPNDRVDLYLGGRGSAQPNASGPMAAPISTLQSTNAGERVLTQQSLTNVRVIAINGSISAGPPAKGGEPNQRVISSISFEVLPMHVRPIITAADAGQLVVALRSPLERPLTVAEGATNDRPTAKPGTRQRPVSTSTINAPNRGRNVGPASSLTDTVTVIRGGGSTSGK